MGSEDFDGLGYSLQRHWADVSEFELVVRRRVDDLLRDQHLAGAGVVGEAGGDVDGAPEIVAFLETTGPAWMPARTAGSDSSWDFSTIDMAAWTPEVGSGK